MITRQQQLDTLAQIEQIADDSTRWRAIQRLMFKLHPQLVHLDQMHLATVKAKRDELRTTTGSTKSLSMRALYSMPEYLYRALQAADPQFRFQQESKDKDVIKSLNYKIWKAFPEYRLASKL